MKELIDKTQFNLLPSIIMHVIMLPGMALKKRTERRTTAR